MIRPYLDDHTGFARSHEVSAVRLQALCEAYADDVEVGLPLVVEDDGNGALVLDGHHRIAAQEARGEGAITCWTVSLEDWEGLLSQHFGGEVPERLCEVDDYVEGYALCPRDGVALMSPSTNEEEA